MLGIRGWAHHRAPGRRPRCGRPWSGSCSSSGSSSSRSPATRTLTVVLVGYTVLTLALMAQFGRDQWRAAGETFTVWFRTLNRLAIYGIVPAATTAEARGVDGGRRGSRCARPVGGPPAAVRERPPRRDLGDPAGRAGRPRHGVDHLRRAVADGRLRDGVRQPGARPEDRAADRVPVDRSRAPRWSVGRAVSWGAIGAGLHADRRRLPRRPLPDLPADRRPADHRRRLRPAADRRRT